MILEKVLIVGGGVAGLSAGVFAQMGGLETHIYEKHFIPGGNLTGWDRQGCHIDNCVHWLTGTRPGAGYFDFWKTLGAIDENTVYQPESFYTSELDGQSVTFWADIEKTRRGMLELSPADEKEINRFIRAVKSAMKMENILDEEYVVKGEKLSPFAVLGYLRTGLKELGERFSHPLLRKAFSDYIMGEYSALALIMAYAAFAGGNGGLPVGGSRAMAERIAERYESLGGTLHLGKGISGLIRKGDRVCGAILDDGTRVGCDYVIFACDPYVTYSLLGQKMPKGLTKNVAAKKLPVYSSLQCAFVADGKAPFSDNVVIESKGYDDIPDRIILREFSHEAGFAPESKNIIQVLIYIHDEQCDEWIGLRANDRATYRERKARMAAACADAIVRRYPELDGKLTLLDSWTPATYHRYFGSHGGAWMGVLLPGRFPLVTKRNVKGVKNAFLATQWLRAPGGLPNAVTGGDEAVKTMMKRIERDRKRPSEAIDITRAGEYIAVAYAKRGRSTER